MIGRTALFILYLSMSLVSNPVNSQTYPFNSHQSVKIVNPKEYEFNCLPIINHATFWQKIGRYRTSSNAIQKINYPLFDWPLINQLHDGLFLFNYVDDDNSNTFADYMGNPHTYNGHQGTDVTLFNFRAMDRGMKIVAAADGTVVETVFSKQDRNTKPPYPDFGNRVIVQHDDGTHAWYVHFRKNSVTVEEGETIEKGDVLGLAGSSGNSTEAHLHFEVGEYINGIWQKRDPWQGTLNTLPSLWQNQEPYVGNDPIKIYDMGVTTRASAGGDENYISFDLFKERLSQPEVFGKDETVIIVWLQVQGQAGDAFTLRVRRSDNSLFDQSSFTLPDKAQRAWYYLDWNFAQNVFPTDYGRWTATISVDVSVKKQVDFEVGENTVFRPRFAPLAGRSFRINEETQRDTLRVSSLGGEVTYSLLNELDFVSLQQDSIVIISATSTQPSRSFYFQAIAMDQAGLKDTMWYHIVDPSKPRTNTVPVELSTFSAKFKDNTVELFWTTLSETNNYGFVVERKSENGSWDKIGFVKGSGTTANLNEYTFLDQNLMPGTTYFYRLKQINSDGSFEYSREIKIDSVPVTITLWQNYPNPFNPITAIRYHIPEDTNVSLQILDLNGKWVSNLIEEKQKTGTYTIEWNAKSLSSGIYFFKLEAGRFTAIKKAVFLK